MIMTPKAERKTAKTPVFHTADVHEKLCGQSQLYASAQGRHETGGILELQRMFEHSNIIRLRFSRTNFFYERTFVDARWSVFGAHIAERSFGRGLARGEPYANGATLEILR